MKRILIALWLAALMTGMAFTTAKTWEMVKGRYDLLATPPLARLDTRLINIVTLGHRGLYDDFINIWALQFLVDSKLTRQNPDDVVKAIRRVTIHHPRIESLYMLSCFVMTFDFKKPEACEAITLDGLRALPDSWRIPVTEGFVYAFKLNDRSKAALYYSLAASKPDAPQFLKAAADKLHRETNLSPEELNETLKELTTVPGGSKFGSFMRGRDNR